MSGTFNEIDVPPTLVSFAVDVAKEKDIITPELKQAGNALMVCKIEKDAYDLPNYRQIMDLYDKVHSLIQQGVIVSAYALDGKGLAAAVSKMAFGNKLGVSIEKEVSAADGQIGDKKINSPVIVISSETISGAPIKQRFVVVGYED